MAANPALQPTTDGKLMPAVYQGEVVALRRDAIDIFLDGVRTASGTWSIRGILYLTSLRLVFVANLADASGLKAFELPLSYLRRVKFNQPIFGANNLAGECWPAQPGGGPAGSLPPHKFALYFKEGGVGTFLPLYYSFSEAAQSRQQQQQGTHSSANPINMVATAFVDPGDPSKLILTQPTPEATAPAAPLFAANFGQDEAYESMQSPRN